jgi:hypothetical protein
MEVIFSFIRKIKNLPLPLTAKIMFSSFKLWMLYVVPLSLCPVTFFVTLSSQ